MGPEENWHCLAWQLLQGSFLRQSGLIPTGGGEAVSMDGRVASSIGRRWAGGWRIASTSKESWISD